MEKIIYRANKAILGHFIFNRTWDMERDKRIIKNLPIDWKLIPYEDEEWNYVLNRMDFLIDIAVAYRESKDIKYKKAIINFIELWIENNIEDLESHRTIDTGIRILNWIEALSFVEESYTNKMIDALNKQIEMLYDRYRLKDDLSNWGLFQTIGVLANKKFIHDYKQIKFWEEKLKLQLDIQINEEGFHWENSIMYQNQILLALCRLYRLDKSIDISKQIRVLAEASNALMKPNYHQVMQNDSDNTDISGLLKFASELIGNLNLGKISEDDISKIYCEKPNEDSSNELLECYPLTGLFVKKNSSMYLSMHNHAYGSSHSHIMPCHINYSIKEDILIDPGRYTYQNIKERYKLKSIRSHNSPIMNNIIKEKIYNSWDTKTNIQRNDINYKLLNNIVYSRASYLCGGYLIVRRIIEIDSNLIVIDQYPIESEKEINLVLGHKINIGKDLRFLENLQIKHNYLKEKKEKTIYSEHYNELLETDKLKLWDDSRELIKYFAIIDNSCKLKERRINNYIVYDFQTKHQNLSICLLEKDVEIGSKIEVISGKKIYGRLVIIDNKRNKIYKIEI